MEKIDCANVVAIVFWTPRLRGERGAVTRFDFLDDANRVSHGRTISQIRFRCSD
jgi:hypothetical protein